MEIARRSFKSLWSFNLLASQADSKDFEVCYIEMWSSREECALLSGGRLIRVAEITVTWTTCVWVRWYINVVPSSKCWTIIALTLNGILLIFYKRHFTRCHSLQIHHAKQEWLWTVQVVSVACFKEEKNKNIFGTNFGITYKLIPKAAFHYRHLILTTQPFKCVTYCSISFPRSLQKYCFHFSQL